MALRVSRWRSTQRGSRSMALDDRINITPFVDVVLVLLVAFMITAPLMTSTIPVNLPTAKGIGTASIGEIFVVTIRSNGRIFVDNNATNDQQLLTVLREKRANAGDQASVYVRADRSVEYGRFVRVVSTIREANFSRLSLVALPPGLDSSAGSPAATPSP